MANFKRIYHTLRLYTITSPMKRARYLKEHNVFAAIGERVMITSRKIPLYAELIKIHNNVWIASDVTFVTHDVSHFMLKGIDRSMDVTEKIGCIEIGDNVFIGTGTKILYDVRIGNNVIIAAGSIVTKDIPDNSIVAGIPARVIGDFDTFVKKRCNDEKYAVNNATGKIDSNDLETVWAQFYECRK